MRTMTRAMIVMVVLVVMVGLLAREGRADFTLWDDEVISVDTSYSIGTLYDESRAYFAPGGSVDKLYAYDNSTVYLSTYGWVGSLSAYHTSTVHISGGSVDYLSASQTSVVDLSGGTVNSVLAWDTSVVTFLARDFRFGDGLSLDGDRVLGTGILSGEWLDGTRWIIDIETNAPGATILAIP